MDEVLGAAVADGKVTPKVQSLIKILLGYQHTDDFRAIIFVERVVAALILPKVIQNHDGTTLDLDGLNYLRLYVVFQMAVTLWTSWRDLEFEIWPADLWT